MCHRSPARRPVPAIAMKLMIARHTQCRGGSLAAATPPVAGVAQLAERLLPKQKVARFEPRLPLHFPLTNANPPVG